MQAKVVITGCEPARDAGDVSCAWQQHVDAGQTRDDHSCMALSFDRMPAVISAAWAWALTTEAQGQVEVLGGPEPWGLRLDAQRGVVAHADIRRVVVVCVSSKRRAGVRSQG